MNVIKPNEINKNKQIPQHILDIVNKHLNENYKGGKLIVNVDAIASKLTHNKKQEAFQNKWFDFEYVYNDAGWNCKFVKTPYYEPHDYWIFEAK